MTGIHTIQKKKYYKTTNYKTTSDTAYPGKRINLNEFQLEVFVG